MIIDVYLMFQLCYGVAVYTFLLYEKLNQYTTQHNKVKWINGNIGLDCFHEAVPSFSPGFSMGQDKRLNPGEI